MNLRKPPLWASAFTILGLGVLGSLGTWQANKYIAKTADMRSAACQKEETLTLSNGFDDLGAIQDQLCHGQVQLNGHLNFSRQINVGPRVHDGDVGYHKYSLLQADDGTSVLINLGWVKDNSNVISTHLEPDVSIEGVLLKPSGRNSFTPDNNAEKGEYYYLQANEIAADWNLENLSEYVLFAQDVSPKPFTPIIPAELSKTYLTPQTHLQYAAFWYFMALAMSVVFFLRFMIKKDD